jgi:hypothetical protein
VIVFALDAAQVLHRYFTDCIQRSNPCGVPHGLESFGARTSCPALLPAAQQFPRNVGIQLENRPFTRQQQHLTALRAL